MIAPNQVPSIRMANAKAHGALNNLLFVVGGGLGDRICAEPTIRWVRERWPNVDVSLCCDTPQVFRHMVFRNVFLTAAEVDSTKFLPVYTYALGLANEFFNANLLNGVDFASVSAARGTLPPQARRVRMEPPAPGPSKFQLLSIVKESRAVIVHVGASWASRTFPGEFWDKVVLALSKQGLLPILVGKKPARVSNPGNMALDWTEQLSLDEYLWVCKHAANVVTNDSSPLHAASTGRGKIAFIPTCRRPDLLLHEREGGWGWRMRAFHGEPMWTLFDYCPNDMSAICVSSVPEGRQIEDFLPGSNKINEMVDWLFKAD